MDDSQGPGDVKRSTTGGIRSGVATRITHYTKIGEESSMHGVKSLHDDTVLAESSNDNNDPPKKDTVPSNAHQEKMILTRGTSHEQNMNRYWENQFRRESVVSSHNGGDDIISATTKMILNIDEQDGKYDSKLQSKLDAKKELKKPACKPPDSVAITSNYHLGTNQRVDEKNREAPNVLEATAAKKLADEQAPRANDMNSKRPRRSEAIPSVPGAVGVCGPGLGAEAESDRSSPNDLENETIRDETRAGSTVGRRRNQSCELEISVHGAEVSAEEFQSSEFQIGEHQSYDRVPKAKMVSDAEAIFVAEDVAQDHFKRNQLLITVVGVLSLALAVILAVVLTKDKDDDIVDPRCKDLANQNGAVHCMCTNTTRAIFEGKPDDHFRLYYHGLSVLRNNSVIEPSVEFDIDSCVPENQALMVMFEVGASGANVDDFIQGPDNLFILAYGIAMIYVRLGGVNWDMGDDWLLYDLEAGGVCGWFGVECVFLEIITGITLPSNGLHGSLPSELELLTKLRTLDLSGNPGISGTLPSEISNIQSMSHLDLSSTSLKGTIPARMGKLKKLKNLLLNDNSLSGTIPSAIADMNLQHLHLQKNRLEGSVPSEIGGSMRLNTLWLHSNAFTGSLPNELANLDALELLHIGQNNFSGSIPDFLGGMDNLEFLSLLDSGLGGPLPETYCANITVGRQNRALVGRCSGVTPLVLNCSCCSVKLQPAVSIQCADRYPETILDIFLSANGPKL